LQDLKTAGPPDCRTVRLQHPKTIKTMYITEILQYLIWPAFIIASWLIIKASLSYYEKKYPAKDED